MNSKQVASVLQREKDLLERVLELAECQMELVESGRAEDLEILLSLRSEPLSELSVLEETMDDESQDMHSNPALTVDALNELQSLNVAILSLANRIANLDERAEFLAEEYENCISPE